MFIDSRNQGKRFEKWMNGEIQKSAGGVPTAWSIFHVLATYVEMKRHQGGQ